MQTIIAELLAKGVRLPYPASVEIGPDVRPERIKPGVVIHGGCRIYGAETLMEEGAVIGFEGPATINNCYVGPKVELGGGYFTEAAFLAEAKAGLGAQVRAGTIMEEQSSIAHTVGLKQTILFPFVTLGSLINFCDCFMAGGTSRKNHSEVGSSYIHFNYTPDQHKATPSLLGDVPKGVMLNQRPIFLGGQGGMTGPCRFSYGITTAAGIIIRKNELKPNRLIFGSGNTRRTSVCYEAKNGKTAVNQLLVQANIIYLANLVALRHWYRYARALFIGPAFSPELHQGLCLTLEKAVAERVLRLEEYAKAFMEIAEPSWSHFKAVFDNDDNVCNFEELRNDFIAKLKSSLSTSGNYLEVITGLDKTTAAKGTVWLQTIVDCITARALNAFPQQT